MDLVILELVIAFQNMKEQIVRHVKKKTLTSKFNSSFFFKKKALPLGVYGIDSNRNIVFIDNSGTVSTQGTLVSEYIVEFGKAAFDSLNISLYIVGSYQNVSGIIRIQGFQSGSLQTSFFPVNQEILSIEIDPTSNPGTVYGIVVTGAGIVQLAQLIPSGNAYNLNFVNVESFVSSFDQRNKVYAFVSSVNSSSVPSSIIGGQSINGNFNFSIPITGEVISIAFNPSNGNLIYALIQNSNEFELLGVATNGTIVTLWNSSVLTSFIFGSGYFSPLQQSYIGEFILGSISEYIGLNISSEMVNTIFTLTPTLIAASVWAPVGCDNYLYSTLVFDNCGVCGGNRLGAPCSTSSSGISSTALIGGIVGGVLAICLICIIIIIIVICLVVRKKRNSSQPIREEPQAFELAKRTSSRESKKYDKLVLSGSTSTKVPKKMKIQGKIEIDKRIFF